MRGRRVCNVSTRVAAEGAAEDWGYSGGWQLLKCCAVELTVEDRDRAEEGRRAAIVGGVLLPTPKWDERIDNSWKYKNHFQLGDPLPAHYTSPAGKPLPLKDWACC